MDLIYPGSRYQAVYPEPPVLDSHHMPKSVITSLLSLEFFEAEPASMPYDTFCQHHILINLNPDQGLVVHQRNDKLHRFDLEADDIIVTPAGVKSSWQWENKSNVVVITLDPVRLKQFAATELGVQLADDQLKNIPPLNDNDVSAVSVLLKQSITSHLGSSVMFESFARIFLVMLIEKYGCFKDDTLTFDDRFDINQYTQVIQYIEQRYSQTIYIKSLAEIAGLNPSQFSRLFKKVTGQTPHQFVMNYRVEQAKIMLSEKRSLLDIALSCGFADQSHFTRVFTRRVQCSPKQYKAFLTRDKTNA